MLIRSFEHRRMFFGFSVIGLLLATLAITQVISVARGAWNVPVQPILPAPWRDYCYNFDFYNQTGMDANDFHITLRGPTSVSWLYNGPELRFTQVAHGLFSDGTYQFHFQGATISPGQKVHIGWCSDSPWFSFVPLNSSLSFPSLRWPNVVVPPGWDRYYVPAFWTKDGVPISRGWLPAIGHTWRNWGGRIGIAFDNALPADVRLVHAEFAVVDNPLPLNDLNWEIAQPIQWQPIEGARDVVIRGVGERVGSANTIELQIPGEFAADDPNYVLVRVWTVDPADPQNIIQSAAQASIQEIMRLGR